MHQNPIRVFERDFERVLFGGIHVPDYEADVDKPPVPPLQNGDFIPALDLHTVKIPIWPLRGERPDTGWYISHGPR